jgi:hypothetical protein
MNVFGHDHVSIDTHREAAARAFKTDDEQVACRGMNELLFTSVTTEGDEVRLSGLMIAPEAGRHELTLLENRGCAKLRRLSLPQGFLYPRLAQQRREPGVTLTCGDHRMCPSVTCLLAPDQLLWQCTCGRADQSAWPSSFRFLVLSLLLLTTDAQRLTTGSKLFDNKILRSPHSNWRGLGAIFSS